MYVDAINDAKNDRIHVIERTSDGTRSYQEFPATMYFIIPTLKASIVLSIVTL
jgi:hypothetical protein